MAKGQQDGMVRTAIPRAKPSNNMQRVSPGVYRDSSGKLVRSRDGQSPAGGGNQASGRGAPSTESSRGGGIAGEAIGNSLIGKPMNFGDGNLIEAVRRLMGNSGPVAQPIDLYPAPLTTSNPLADIVASGMNLRPAPRPGMQQSMNSISDMLRRR
jgi:hypothetical protein